MSFNFSAIKWLWVVIGAVVGAVVSVLITLAVNVGYGVVLGFQMRGAPPQDVLVEALSSTPFVVLGLVWTLIGAFVGGRMAGRHAEGASPLAGLIAGVLMAVVPIFLQGELTGYTMLHMALAIGGGLLGGWMAGRSQQDGQEQFT
ncbi:MAG: hypothetical protein J5I90_02255 [Caldilineales bacterium]|nr:hypothetical protein [Caldilineales bacterium]